MSLAQLSFFGRDEPSFDDAFASVERVELDHGAWFDVAYGWLRGHERVYQQLVETTAWRAEQRPMYGRQVEVPRLCGVLDEGARPLFVEAMRRALDRHYQTAFVRVSAAFYRNGSDSVAWHGDTVGRELDTALVATVSVGAPRKFLLRPTGGGRSLALSLGAGDLLVMGGTIQRTYQHAVPKVVRSEPRVSIMFRPVWEKP